MCYSRNETANGDVIEIEHSNGSGIVTIAETTKKEGIKVISKFRGNLVISMNNTDIIDGTPLSQCKPFQVVEFKNDSTKRINILNDTIEIIETGKIGEKITVTHFKGNSYEHKSKKIDGFPIIDFKPIASKNFTDTKSDEYKKVALQLKDARVLAKELTPMSATVLPKELTPIRNQQPPEEEREKLLDLPIVPGGPSDLPIAPGGPGFQYLQRVAVVVPDKKTDAIKKSQLSSNNVATPILNTANAVNLSEQDQDSKITFNTTAKINIAGVEVLLQRDTPLTDVLKAFQNLNLFKNAHGTTVKATGPNQVTTTVTTGNATLEFSNPTLKLN